MKQQVTYEQFANKPKHQGLPSSEIRRRWQQHLSNQEATTSAQTQTGGLSPCCSGYAAALTDPWCVEIPPGIPSDIPLPSFKFSGRSRGTFTIGSGGTGFVAANPYAPWGSQSLPNAQYMPILFTSATYASTDTYRPYQSATGLALGVAAVTLDCPFDFNRYEITSPPTGLSYRVVGYGIKIRFVGSEMNRGGRVYAARSPINTPIVTASASAFSVSNVQLTANKETSTVPVDREWHCALYKPSVGADLAYSERGDTITIGSQIFPTELLQGPSLLMLVTGATAGQSFEFDIQGWFEAIGPNVPSLTPTISDPIGMAALATANANTQPTTNVDQNKAGYMSMAIDALHSMSGMVYNHVSNNAPAYANAAHTAYNVYRGANPLRTLTYPTG